MKVSDLQQYSDVEFSEDHQVICEIKQWMFLLGFGFESVFFIKSADGFSMIWGSISNCPQTNDEIYQVYP